MADRKQRVTRGQVLRAMEESWPAAQRRWSRFLLLTEPVDDPEQPSVAQIDLRSRQISVNVPMICRKQLLDSVEGILAHEVGHHVRYPGSLTVEARLRLLERQLLPGTPFSIINLFEDLMINERLGRTMRDQLIAVYQAFTGGGRQEGDADADLDSEPDSESDSESDSEMEAFGEATTPVGPDSLELQNPAFWFYLTIYEELWRLTPGALIGPRTTAMASRFPGYRAEAQILAQNLFAMGPNIYTQFLYFFSIMAHYIQIPDDDEEQPTIFVVYQCDRGEPGPGDWADALEPDARERTAILRAIREGWLDEETGEQLAGGTLEDRIAGLPGHGSLDATLIPEVMASFYRQQAERFLFRPPRQRVLGEAVVPTTVVEWESGDPVRSIDWLTTFVQRGEVLGSAMPLVRTQVAEYEGHEVSFWRPRMEIYLDVSGSMPDPRDSHNAMTLAAQILVAGTIRAGGWVRALLYSGDSVRYWEWCRSEVEMSRFLMHYIGGGTDYPFATLDDSVAECRRDQPIRVVISDWDFDRNYDDDERAPDILARAIEASSRFILLLHTPDPGKIKRYRDRGASVIEVAKMDDFPRMAADLTFALFPTGYDTGLDGAT